MRLPLPDAVEGAPRLYDHLELYWWAYQDLSTCRPASFSGVHTIPFTTVMDYAASCGYDEDQAEDLAYFVRIMDAEFLRWYEEKHGGKQKRAGISDKNGAPRRVPGLGGR